MDGYLDMVIKFNDAGSNSFADGITMFGAGFFFQCLILF